MALKVKPAARAKQLTMQKALINVVGDKSCFGSFEQLLTTSDGAYHLKIGTENFRLSRFLEIDAGFQRTVTAQFETSLTADQIAFEQLAEAVKVDGITVVYSVLPAQ